MKLALFLLALGVTSFAVMAEAAQAGVPIVFAHAVLWLVAVHSKIGRQVRIVRRMQKWGFDFIIFGWAAAAIGIAIIRPVPNDPHWDLIGAAFGALVLAGLIFLAVDFFREVMKPPTDIPEAWR